MYQQMIADDLKKLGITDVQPRWVEASMRLQYGALSHLPRDVFITECYIAKAMLDESSEAEMNSMAESMGL